MIRRTRIYTLFPYTTLFRYKEENEAAFGLTALPADELDSIQSTITDIRYKPRGERIVTLANGQVWEQRDSYTKPKLHLGERVTIKRGSLGSFSLRRDAGGRSIRVRRWQP